MKNFNDDAIRNAAYYIWQNNGCPANSSSYDWNSAINQLGASVALSQGRKKVDAKSAAPAMAVAKAAVALKNAAASKKMPSIVLTSKKSK